MILPLLLVVFPLAMAGGCAVLRKSPGLVLIAGLVTLAVECGLALSAAPDQPMRVLGIAIQYDAPARTMLVATCAGAIIATLTAAAGEHGEYFVSVLLLIIGCAAGMVLSNEPLIGAGLLLICGLAGGVQLADRPAGSVALIRPRALAIALRYTVLLALGGLVMLLGMSILGGAQARSATAVAALQPLIWATLLFGYAVRCGLLPFHIWLPELVEDAPPATAALNAGVLAVLALPVLLSALEAQPQLLAGNAGAQRLLIGLGALSAVGAGVLGASANARRSLAYLAIADLGLLSIGAGIGGALGLQAAVRGAIGHIAGVGLAALGLALLSAASVQQRGEDLVARRAGGVALVLGVLLLLGVPPFAGFAPRLLLLAAAWQNNPWIAALVVAGIGSAGLAAARVLGQALQPAAMRMPAGDEPAPLGAPGTQRTSRVLLALSVLVSLAAAFFSFEF